MGVSDSDYDCMALSGAHFTEHLIPERVRGAGWIKDLSWLFAKRPLTADRRSEILLPRGRGDDKCAIYCCVVVTISRVSCVLLVNHTQGVQPLKPEAIAVRIGRNRHGGVYPMSPSGYIGISKLAHVLLRT